MSATIVTPKTLDAKFQMIPNVNTLRASQQIGWCHSALKRMVWSDLWASWEQVHLALGLPMDWRGGMTMQSVDPVSQWMFLLRSLDTADFLRALAEADRHMRRARMNVYREHEQSHETLTKLIDLHRDDETTRGLEDQAGRVAELCKLREQMDAERVVLFTGSAAKGHAWPMRDGQPVADTYVEAFGSYVRIALDQPTEGTEIRVYGELCPECAEPDWALTADPDQQYLQCNDCERKWPIKFGIPAEVR